jgi:transmembrane sensor
MSNPDEATKRAARIDDEAREWLVRLRGDTALHRDAFEEWYVTDPDHADAYDRLLLTWEASGRLLRADDRQTAPARTSRGWRAAIGALAVLLLVGVGIGVATLAGFGRTPANAFSIETRVGEIRTDQLADGTRVTLDTDSRVEGVFTASRRELRLVRGRARIAAASDPDRPLQLAVADASIDAGRIVDVASRDGQATVAMVAGAGAVCQGNISVPVPPGEIVSIASAGQINAPTALRESDTRWPTGMLSFDNAPLGDVVAEANRYSATRIVLAGSGVAALRFSGTFRAGDAKTLARMVSAAFSLSVSNGENGSLVLRQTPARK